MATNWTNPIGPGSRLLAFDVQEVINAINSKRAAAGLQPFPWTYPAPSSGDRILAKRYLEMRQAIQDLWNLKGMGVIPPWHSGQAPASGTRMFARDLLDCRKWLNQYEDAPATVRVSTLKGMHLPTGGAGQFRFVDHEALDDAIPSFGMMVALSTQLDLGYTSNSGTFIKMADVMNWYANNRATELFTRLFPGPGPVPDPRVPPSPSYVQKTYSQVVDDIVALRNARGVNFRRIIPGNEANIEWPPSGTYHDSAGNPVTWTDYVQINLFKAINAYYKEILDELNRRKALGQAPADIELYYPAMAQSAGAEGIGRYCDNGLTQPFSFPDGSVGYDHLKESIELYGRFTWHDYFFSWHAFEGCVSNYFPQWLKDDLYVSGFPSRITECGWYPSGGGRPGERRDRDSAAGTYTQYKCDDVTPEGTFSEGTYPDDLIWFITQSRTGGLPPASGVAIWLLSTLDAEFDMHVAVRAEQRPWYRTFKLWQP